jgi:hypothetical protein
MKQEDLIEYLEASSELKEAIIEFNNKVEANNGK